MLGTGRFVPRVVPAPTPTAAGRARSEGSAAAREHWHVESEVVRVAVTGPWKGWLSDAAGARPCPMTSPRGSLAGTTPLARVLATEAVA